MGGQVTTFSHIQDGSVVIYDILEGKSVAYYKLHSGSANSVIFLKGLFQPGAFGLATCSGQRQFLFPEALRNGQELQKEVDEDTSDSDESDFEVDLTTLDHSLKIWHWEHSITPNTAQKAPSTAMIIEEPQKKVEEDLEDLEEICIDKKPK